MTSLSSSLIVDFIHHPFGNMRMEGLSLLEKYSGSSIKLNEE